MTLLEKALEAISDQVDDKVDDWVDKLVGELEELVDSVDDAELRAGSKEALEVLKTHQDQIADLGRKSLILFIGHVAAGNFHKATKEYYRTKADPDEIINGIIGDALEMERVRKEAEQLKKDALDLARSFGKSAIKLLPLLLSIW